MSRSEKNRLGIIGKAIVGAGLLLIAACMAAFIYLVSGMVYQSEGAVLEVPDVSQSWRHQYVDRGASLFFLRSECLTVAITGRLDGAAEVMIGAGSHVVGPGDVFIQMTAAEWWHERCYLAYTPGGASNGVLKIAIDID